MEAVAQEIRFEKEDLLYTYNWNRKQVKIPVGKKTFNRSQGHEMLHFINEFFNSHNLSSAASFKRAEYLLYNHLPINIKNRDEVRSWLLKYWHHEFYTK
ncbi:hypothetical protein ACLI1A_08040 [Flavobacterium sp. RHBU_3]|uniref:hypothetical protein n=1 Tax=Flavobacterium sp. RHBU_3 TaxID=3391184 RepID=UPI0039846476